MASVMFACEDGGVSLIYKGRHLINLNVDELDDLLEEGRIALATMRQLKAGE